MQCALALPCPAFFPLSALRLLIPPALPARPPTRLLACPTSPQVPTLCTHPRLPTTPGTCRICMVDTGARALVVSASTAWQHSTACMVAGLAVVDTGASPGDVSQRKASCLFPCPLPSPPPDNQADSLSQASTTCRGWPLLSPRPQAPDKL